MAKGEEVIKTLQQYFSTDGVMHYFGDNKSAIALTELFALAVPYIGDAPDMFFLYNNQVLIVEHFEFDCYRATRKGSAFRREEARIQRAFDSTPMTGNSLIRHDKIHAEFSYKDYVENIIRSFSEHYARVNQYIINLTEAGVIKDNSVVNTLFLIDDVSPIGLIMIDNNAPWGSDATCTVELCHCKVFLDLLSSSPKVDYVISCSSFGSKRIVWLIDQKNIKEYYNHVVDYESMDYVRDDPYVVTASILIPKEEID